MNENNKENTPSGQSKKKKNNKKTLSTENNKINSPTLLEKTKYFVTNFTDAVSSKFSSPKTIRQTNNVFGEKSNSTASKTKHSLNFLKKKPSKISSEALPSVNGNDLGPIEAKNKTFAGSQSVPLKRKSIEPQITKSPTRKLSKQCLNETFTLETITANDNNKNNIVNSSFVETTFDDSDKDPTFAIGNIN